MVIQFKAKVNTLQTMSLWMLMNLSKERKKNVVGTKYRLFIVRREEEEAEAEAGEEIEEPEEEIIQRDSIYVFVNNRCNSCNSLQSFENHTDSVLCCAIHPSNHDLVVTGGQDNHSFFINYVKPEQNRELEGHEV